MSGRAPAMCALGGTAGAEPKRIVAAADGEATPSAAASAHAEMSAPALEISPIPGVEPSVSGSLPPLSGGHHNEPIVLVYDGSATELARQLRAVEIALVDLECRAVVEDPLLDLLARVVGPDR